MARARQPQHSLSVIPPMPHTEVSLSGELQAQYEVGWLQPKMQKFLAVMDPVNCLAELAIARALHEDFLQNFEKQNAWFEAWSRDGLDDGQRPRPVRLLYPDDSLKYIEMITRCADRIQRLRESDALTRAEMRWKMVQLGAAVEDEIAQTEAGVGWKQGLQERIVARWRAIWS